MLENPTAAQPVVSSEAPDLKRAKALEVLRLAESRTGVKCHEYRQQLDRARVLAAQERAAAQQVAAQQAGAQRPVAGNAAADEVTPGNIFPAADTTPANVGATTACIGAASDAALATLPSTALPVQPKLAHLFPQRCLTPGSVITVQGGMWLLFGLLAAASQHGSWVSFVGMPELGVLAASQAGLALERVAVIPQVGTEAAAVIAALLDATCVVVGPQAALSEAERRRLTARTRELGALLFTTQPWRGANLNFEVTGQTWAGTDQGQGCVESVSAKIHRIGRGAAAAPKTFPIELPLTWSGAETGGAAREHNWSNIGQETDAAAPALELNLIGTSP